MKLNKLALLATVGVSLAACTSVSYEDRNADLSDSFAQNLKDRYIALADWEDEQGDYIDGNWYTDKAKMLVGGMMVEPTTLDNRSLPTEHLNELAQARNALMAALSKGAATVDPVNAAEAQTKFDCWVEQAEENFQPEHIEMCKTDFFNALNAIKWPAPKVVEAPKVEPKPVMVKPAEFIVFFDFDSANLTYGGVRVVEEVASHIGSMKPNRIVVGGHADRSGAEDYNMELARKRAVSVATKLAEMGVPKDAMTLQSFGEGAPRVETADGIKEPENRFVKITISR